MKKTTLIVLAVAFVFAGCATPEPETPQSAVSSRPIMSIERDITNLQEDLKNLQDHNRNLEGKISQMEQQLDVVQTRTLAELEQVRQVHAQQIAELELSVDQIEQFFIDLMKLSGAQSYEDLPPMIMDFARVFDEFQVLDRKFESLREALRQFVMD